MIDYEKNTRNPLENTKIIKGNMSTTLFSKIKINHIDNSKISIKNNNLRNSQKVFEIACPNDLSMQKGDKIDVSNSKKVLDKYSSKSSLGKLRPGDKVYSTIAQRNFRKYFHSINYRFKNIDGWMNSNNSLGIRRKSSGLFSCVSLPDLRINRFETSFDQQESIEEKSLPKYLKGMSANNNDLMLQKDPSSQYLKSHERKLTLINGKINLIFNLSYDLIY